MPDFPMPGPGGNPFRPGSPLNRFNFKPDLGPAPTVPTGLNPGTVFRQPLPQPKESFTPATPGPVLDLGPIHAPNINSGFTNPLQEKPPVDTYAESMRQQAEAMRQGEKDRAASIQTAYEQSDEAGKAAIRARYAGEVLAVPIYKRPIFWVGVVGVSALLLAVALKANKKRK